MPDYRDRQNQFDILENVVSCESNHASVDLDPSPQVAVAACEGGGFHLLAGRLLGDIASKLVEGHDEAEELCHSTCLSNDRRVEGWGEWRARYVEKGFRGEPSQKQKWIWVDAVVQVRVVLVMDHGIENQQPIVYEVDCAGLKEALECRLAEGRTQIPWGLVDHGHQIDADSVRQAGADAAELRGGHGQGEPDDVRAGG